MLREQNIPLLLKQCHYLLALILNLHGFGNALLRRGFLEVLPGLGAHSVHNHFAHPNVLLLRPILRTIEFLVNAIAVAIMLTEGLKGQVLQR